MSVIKVKDVHKKFKIYHDKNATLKERILFKNRNHYEDRWVLKGINLDVDKGETLGIIGQNGCGKSTLLKLLTRIIYPDQGSIEISGRVSSLLELGAGFHPEMSGRENIYINAAIFGLTKKEIDARLDEIIEFSELQEYLDNPVRTYSSGMYMRLAFSVAINVDADILLIDEILAVGDTNFQAKCFRKLRELKSKGTVIVLVSHDATTVETFCDKVLWINNGEIQASGKSKPVIDKYLEYMNQELYESMQASEEHNRERSEEKQKPDITEEFEARDEEEINYKANRFGLKHIEITKAGFINKKGEFTSIIRHGESAELRIFYKVNKPLMNYNFGMGFYTMDYICIYGVNTQLDGYEITDLPEEGYMSFIIDNVMLLSGKYILQVAIVDGNGTPMDYYQNYEYFDVVANIQAIGISEMRHTWNINTEARN